MPRRLIIFAFLFVVIISALGYGGYYWYKNGANLDSLGNLSIQNRIDALKNLVGISPQAKVTYKTPEEADAFVRFEMEAYDKILQNYWSKTNDGELSELFRLSLAKAASTSPDLIILPTKDRAGTAKMLATQFANTQNIAKKDLAINTAIVVLYNLQPAGRNGLLSSEQETELRNNEKNINPAKNLYQDLGVLNNASQTEVNKAFENKKAELSASTSPEAKAKLQEAAYAHEVLTREDTKARYDQAKIEPTVFEQRIGGTLYFYWDKVSPTTLEEFGMNIINASTTPGLDSLIIDLRGNIGGTLDFARYFLGLFIGQNQYAFDLFHQGDYQVQRTVLAKLPELNRYKEIAILTDNMTQSTAELITATLKRFRMARVVGTATRGWGTVENTYPMDTVIDPAKKYSLLLVNSLTLRDDNQPIEGLGVDPDVDITKPGWQNKLPQFFRQPSLISALSKVASAPPMK